MRMDVTEISQAPRGAARASEKHVCVFALAVGCLLVAVLPAHAARQLGIDVSDFPGTGINWSPSRTPTGSLSPGSKPPKGSRLTPPRSSRTKPTGRRRWRERRQRGAGAGQHCALCVCSALLKLRARSAEYGRFKLTAEGCARDFVTHSLSYPGLLRCRPSRLICSNILKSIGLV
jgi:hypothetical protein